jgi:hypothetical protein
MYLSLGYVNRPQDPPFAGLTGPASALEDTGNQLLAVVSGNDQTRHVELG